MALFCSNPPKFHCNDTPLENVQESRYLGMTLSDHNGRVTNAMKQMAYNSTGAIARVKRICSELVIRKHAMLLTFQVFALSAGLHGCQVWATDTLTFKSSTRTKTRIFKILECSAMQ